MLSNSPFAATTTLACVVACIAPNALANDKLLQSMVPQMEMPAVDYDWLGR